jgi:hypothetical protein
VLLTPARICCGARQEQRTIGKTAATAWEPAAVVFVSLVLLAGACSCELPSGIDFLEQPGHVLAEDLADQEEVVDRVEGVDRAGRWLALA